MHKCDEQGTHESSARSACFATQIHKWQNACLVQNGLVQKRIDDIHYVHDKNRQDISSKSLTKKIVSRIKNKHVDKQSIRGYERHV